MMIIRAIRGRAAVSRRVCELTMMIIRGEYRLADVPDVLEWVDGEDDVADVRIDELTLRQSEANTR